MSYLRIFGLTLLTTTAGAAAAADLRVNIVGTTANDAPVYFSLFDSDASFERLDGSRLAVVKSWTTQPSVAFTDLPPGRYAVAAFQDTNGNQDLDTNLLGQPIEPFGLSRNATGNMGPPKFDDAAIDVDSDMSITIELRR